MTFKIHPAIGIARLGNSPTKFHLAPETEGGLPIECDAQGVAVRNPDGTERQVTNFRDSEGRIKRQAARFRVFRYDESSPQGQELKVGDRIQFVLEQKRQPLSGSQTGQQCEGTVLDIQWTAYLANKKAVWYEFQETRGEHGYEATHPLRNANIKGESARAKLIIDPGPQTVQFTNEKRRSAHFAAGANPGVPQTFPPPLQPSSITTLGEIRAIQEDSFNRLIVLGGFGNSGSFETGFGQPSITTYANNDGWFDDTSDGPVTAALVVEVNTIDGKAPDPNIYKLPLKVVVPVDSPAWVIVGYPRYAPQVVDMVTMDDVVYDVAVRYFAFNRAMYGVRPFDTSAPPPSIPEALGLWRRQASWNPDYYPYFERDIWPILVRPANYGSVMVFDPLFGGDPHNTGARGNFDKSELSIPPHHGEDPADRERRARFLYQMLRKPGQENVFTLDSGKGGSTYRPIAMPWLCGDNPLTNVAPSKFLRLTDTMLFILRQWADGKFISEAFEGIEAPSQPPGVQLDRGVLSNLLGGAFCPGAEACWIMRNPTIYRDAYRLAHKTGCAAGALSQKGLLSEGLEPGDITRYSALPWQADFNECTTQPIDVTYADWNVIDPLNIGGSVVPNVQTTFWWPSHRPMQITPPNGPSYAWSGSIPQTPLGDLQMVAAWSQLDFIVNGAPVRT